LKWKDNLFPFALLYFRVELYFLAPSSGRVSLHKEAQALTLFVSLNSGNFEPNSFSAQAAHPAAGQTREATDLDPEETDGESGQNSEPPVKEFPGTTGASTLASRGL